MKKRKKTTAKRRRRNSGLSSAPTTYRRRRKNSGLSDMFTPSSLKAAVMTTVSSSVGGMLAIPANKIIPNNWSPLIKGALVFGLATAASAMGYGNTASGFNGAMMAITFGKGALNDNTDFADDDVLNDAPIYITEDGTPVKMLADGSFEYLSEEELADAYPEYSTANVN